MLQEALPKQTTMEIDNIISKAQLYCSSIESVALQWHWLPNCVLLVTSAPFNLSVSSFMRMAVTISWWVKSGFCKGSSFYQLSSNQAALRRNTVDVLPSKRPPQPLGLTHIIAEFLVFSISNLVIRNFPFLGRTKERHGQLEKDESSWGGSSQWPI